MSPCRECDGKCCKYFALELDTPKRKADFDHIRWYLAHKDVSVFVEKRKWFLEIKNECRYLTEDHRCSVYPIRPEICREHDAYTCERTFDDFCHDIVFHDMAEFDRYLERRSGKKKPRSKKGKRRG